MISVTFRSMGKPYSDGEVTIDSLASMQIDQIPGIGEYVSVRGTVTHDSEGKMLPALRRFELAGYVNGVTHHIDNPLRETVALSSGVSRHTTVWLSSHKETR